MEFKIELCHGPIVFAVDLVAFSLDTGEEVSRMMLHSFDTDIALDNAKDYLNTLQRVTGFDVIVTAIEKYIEEDSVYGAIEVNRDDMPWRNTP